MTKPPQTPNGRSLKPGLAGRCFITRNEHGRTVYQGVVHCIVPSQQGDLALVQYFEWMFGDPNTMALIPLAGMIETRPGGYIFFEDDEHLRDYMDNFQTRRDQLIDKEQAKEKARAKLYAPE